VRMSWGFGGSGAYFAALEDGANRQAPSDRTRYPYCYSER